MEYNVSIQYKDEFVEAVCKSMNLKCVAADLSKAVNDIRKVISFYRQADQNVSIKIEKEFMPSRKKLWSRSETKFA